MRFSVIIPMYNAAKTIKNAMNSIINQTYTEPIEIIVINDGSKDECEKIVEKMISHNQTNRVMKLINQSNSGVSRARNRGIVEARGDYLLFLDSDDVYEESLVDELAQKIKMGIDLVSFGYRREAGKNKEEKYYINQKYNLNIFNKNDLVKLFLLKIIYQHISSFCVKKSLIMKYDINFNESVTLGEDIAFQIKAMSVAERSIYISKIYFNYVYNDSSVTNSELSDKHLSYVENYTDVKNFFFKNKILEILPYLNFYYQYEFFYMLRLFLLNKNNRLLSRYLEYESILNTKNIFFGSKKYFSLMLLKIIYKIYPKFTKFLLEKTKDFI